MANDIMRLIQKKKTSAEPELNFFKKWYNQLKDKMTPDDEIFAKYDLTDMVFTTMRDIILNRELWNCGVVGEPGSGKSTVMGLLMSAGNKIMADNKLLFLREDKTFDKKRLKEFDNYSQIVADQIEFIGLVNKELWSCFIGIDEFNRLGETGLNSSVESNLYATYSDIFAQQHVNRISCSPSVVNDVNCWLIFEVYGTNKKKRTTTCKVVYRDVVSGQRQVLGHANFYVGDILEEEWYKKYRTKKFKRMELLQKQGIRKISELDFAPIILKIYRELETTMYGGNKADNDVVLGYVIMETKNVAFIGSMIAEQEIASRVRGLLGVKNAIEKEKNKLQNEKKKDIDDQNKRMIKVLEQGIEKNKEILKKNLDFQEKMIKIKEEYLSIR